MASDAAIAAPTASPISSLKYGSCHLSGDSATPSSDTNSDASTFLMWTSSGSKCQLRVRQTKYPHVAPLCIGDCRETGTASRFMVEVCRALVLAENQIGS